MRSSFAAERAAQRRQSLLNNPCAEEAAVGNNEWKGSISGQQGKNKPQIINYQLIRSSVLLTFIYRGK